MKNLYIGLKESKTKEEIVVTVVCFASFMIHVSVKETDIYCYDKCFLAREILL